MNRIFGMVMVVIIAFAASVYAEYPAPRTITLYDEKKQPDEISTIFVSPTDCYLEMHIKAIDGRRFNEKKMNYIIDMNRYLVLPGPHDIVVGYAYFTADKKYSDRKKVYDELTATITTKPGYMYELCQNHRRYVNEPKEIRVREYRPGEEYFEVYRINVKEIKAQIETLDPEKDRETISDKYSELARVYQKLREHKDTVEAYENAIKFNPKKPALYGMVVPSLIKIKEYPKAIQTIEQMKKYEKREWVTNGLCGEVYGDMGQYDKAIEYFTKAVKSAPVINKEGLRGRLAYFYNKAGMDEKYRLTMKEALEDREKKDKLFIEITKEVLELKKTKKQPSEEGKKAYEAAYKKILDKYDLNDDKLFEIVTSTMERHEKEFAGK